MSKSCKILIKGALRCGMPLIPGRKYCANHKPKKQYKAKPITPPVFEGNRTVEKSNYENYLQSPQWKEKAKLEKEKNPNCSLCNRRGELHVHHRTYVRCGQEKNGDLIVLCADCHNIFHKHYRYDENVGYFVGK